MKTLIIFHGWQSSKEKWQKIKEILEKNGIRVILPDLPGFKKENYLGRVWNLDDYIDWFAKKILNNVSEPFFLLGHSFGGRMAIKFSAEYPEKISGLILVSSAGIKPPKNTRRILFLILARIGKTFSFSPFYSYFKKFFYKFIVRKTDYLKTEGFLKETFKNIIEEDITFFLEKIQAPTLILWGEKDKITLLTDAYLMKEKIKNSKLEVFSGVGHTPHLEIPEKLSEEIKRFLF